MGAAGLPTRFPEGGEHEMTDAPWDIMRSLLGLDAEQLSAGQMALRALLTFVVTIAVVRLGDKRLFGKGTAFDIIVAIMIGSIMSRAVTGSSPLFATWVAGAVLVGLHWLLAASRYDQHQSLRLPWRGGGVRAVPRGDHERCLALPRHPATGRQ
jgi:hypothetical protein